MEKYGMRCIRRLKTCKMAEKYLIISMQAVWLRLYAHSNFEKGERGMKMRKYIASMAIILLAVTLVGCGSSKAPEAEAFERWEAIAERIEGEKEDGDSVAEESIEESTEKTAEDSGKSDANNGTEEVSESGILAEKETENLKNTTEDLTFEDLSLYRFEFCSGAGGWSTELFIEKDGSFHGKYHDSNMGSAGEGYPDGTMYYCSFEGKFKDLVKVDDLSYEMKLDTVTFADEPWTEEIIDGVLYIYTDWYGLEGTDTYKIYLPGTEITELSEEVYFWVAGANGEDVTELTIPIIVNEPMQYGIYSYKRPSPLEDATMTFHTYQESYEYYEECYQNAATTMEMLENAEFMYQMADGCLNYIWNIIKYNVEEGRYNVILAEQRTWITYKEEKAKEAAAINEGNMMGSVVYNKTLAEETMGRCQELMEYLEEKVD